MEILGDFELYRDQLVGKGGGGAVYKGRQISLNRPVAIKFLNKEFTSDNLFVKRFHREAECLCKLVDEHVIQIYGAGEYQGDYYYVMEYVPGLPLAKFAQHKYNFSPNDVVYVGIAVAKALKAAWDSGERIIHRDIKPSNIMMAFPQSVLDSGRLDMKQARIKVMDFGLARVVESVPQNSDLTISGTIVGTPKYFSPEQALSQPVDIRTDIYSLGIVLYEIASGQHPFKGETFLELINEHVHSIPPGPRGLNPKIPEELEAIIVKCIQKEPKSRYLTPSELLDDLEAVKQKRAPVHAKPIPAAPGLKPNARTSKLALWSMILGIAGIILAIVCIGYLMALTAIAFGIIALVKISRSQGLLLGRGKAIAGIILGGLSVVILPVVLATIFLSGMSDISHKPVDPKCINNLKRVYTGLMQYKMENNSYPERISFLFSQVKGTWYPAETDNLSCPSVRIGPKHPSWAGYEFTSKELTDKLNGNAPIIWDRKGNHKGGRNVLFFDGQVKFLSEEEFQKLNK